jgi:hypothetical protein
MRLLFKVFSGRRPFSQLRLNFSHRSRPSLLSVNDALLSGSPVTILGSSHSQNQEPEPSWRPQLSTQLLPSLRESSCPSCVSMPGGSDGRRSSRTSTRSRCTMLCMLLSISSASFQRCSLSALHTVRTRADVLSAFSSTSPLVPTLPG